MADLDKLNLRHLYYFWVIAREGAIVRAAEHLDLTPQTLSGQLAAFESALGNALFRRANRSLQLTDFGQTVFSYADDMFQTAQALTDVLRQPPENRPLSLSLGIAASIHKLIAFSLTAPALALSREVRLNCRTGDTAALLKRLGQRELDVVLTDCLPDSREASQFRSYRLASSSMSLFAAPELANRLSGNFPASLDGQPFLATSLDAPYIHALMNWFSSQGIRVKLVAEVDDSALIKVFGREGLGYFAAPTSIREEVCRQYQVIHVASIGDVRDTLYAVTRARGGHNEAVAELLKERPDLTD
ncbi:LysR family transcriptional regulator [Marinobacter lipolyticus]|uniref:LysR substrate-binding domain-containing protein n=1 Tax=Marinobacter lipolyticus TaxID=209639 RepID=UPI001BCE5B52|nr:LysR substrate-binding domain-containing protein [Marinobacter lipolyticus]MBS8240918.1 LysR family transcriptional regulator [Marinobacter lipolyticus]